MRQFNSEERFFHTIAAQLGATDQDHKVNGKMGYKLQCPRCNNSTAGFGIGKRGNTYILWCYQGCGYSANLNDLVNQYGSDELKSEWWELSYGPRPAEWGGIKNRRPPGPKKNFKKDRTKTPIDGLSSDLTRLQIRAQIEQDQQDKRQQHDLC